MSVESRLRVHGQSVYPMAMTVPAGLLVVGVLLDVGHAAAGWSLLAATGYFTITAGLFAGALVLGAGLVDLWDVPAGPGRRVRVGYLLTNVAAFSVFLICLVARGDTAGHAAPTGVLLLESAALGSCGVGTWYGARLVRSANDADEPSPDIGGSTVHRSALAGRPSAPRHASPRPRPDRSAAPERPRP